MSSKTDGSDSEDGFSRRTILAALGVGGVGAAGGYALLGGDGAETTPSVSDPSEDAGFEAFEAIRDAMRTSPDHLPVRAAGLVDEGDADAIFAFVRDELAVDPSGVEDMDDANRTRRWGPRGTLRGGTGTPLDIADTLAKLFADAGFEADVVDVRPRLTAEQVREMLFRPPSREFAPNLSEAEAAHYRDVVGGDEIPSAVDVGGSESAALAESILDVYPGADAVDEPFYFGWDRFAKLPIVRVDIDGEMTYANPFLPDATLDTSGLGENPKIWEDTSPDAYPTVQVTLSAATANDRWNPHELVTGDWSAADLPGRQVRVDMLSGIDPFQNPGVRFSDIDTFVPALTVSDPHAGLETVQSLSVQGDAVTRSGATLTVDDDGVVYRDGRPVVDPAAGVDPTVVDTVEATVDTARYPNVRLGVTAYDATGDAVEGLPAAAFEVVDDEPTGISVAATTSAPRVQLLVDRSGSMPSAYADDVMADLVGRLRDAITTGHEGARIEQTWTNSDIYTNLAEAAESDANLIVYATDGDVGDELTPGISEVLRAGPPALMMNVDRRDRDALREMATLSGGTYRMVDGHDDAVATVTDFVDATAADLPSYLLDYTAPTDWAAGDERVATVSVPESTASADTEYVVPGSTVLPDEFASLQLTVRIGGREVTRTLAGWDPIRDAERTVSEADMDAVAGALFGEHVLSFEAAATTESVWLDDILTSKLSVRGIHEAATTGDAEAVRDALDAGFTVTPADLMLLQGPMPNPITEDSHTYQDTLRVVLHQQRPQFGTDQILQHTDALDLTKYRTVADDPTRAFRLTAQRTARVAVVEDALYDDSAASILDGRDLVPFREVAADWEDDENQAADARVVEARSGNEVALVADDDGPFAFWTVNVDTGTVAGVLDDGSGGGYSQARIEEQLQRLSRAIAVVNLLALASGKAGLVSGPGGLALGAVAAYGQVLARLYGQVSLAITIMNADHLDRAIGQAAIALGCNLAKDLAMFRLGDDISAWVENIFGSVGGPSIC
ncbi:hypothetical protein GJ629_04580 [Halapricum sp. CBA1109]|uniref:hypothetical protein n=1 Tax=Halapricum sp. CBA1109 TaxID=2668068 RepID=UPI0012FC055C|nr:hypothetical protein [Halapricum sp. CBA1109]MUV89263.1 hypothetical protein [Halapricum sp. CBA1109]